VVAGLGITALLTAAVAGWLVLASPWLRVSTVRVVGASTLDPVLIERRAAVPVGTPLARVDLGALQQRVREIPQIAAVDVTRSWPHTVTIRVVEAQPVAVIRDGAGFGLVSASGQVYRTVAQPPAGLPLVANESAALASDPGAQAALAVAVALGRDAPASLLRRVQSVRGLDAQDVRVKLRGGAEVRWGGALGTTAKAQALLLLIRTQPGAQRYDVASPQTPGVLP
jgi:cell division protein FtsQ